jgi:hypothetical protein
MISAKRRTERRDDDDIEGRRNHIQGEKKVNERDTHCEGIEPVTLRIYK